MLAAAATTLLQNLRPRSWSRRGKSFSTTAAAFAFIPWAMVGAIKVQ